LHDRSSASRLGLTLVSVVLVGLVTAAVRATPRPAGAPEREVVITMSAVGDVMFGRYNRDKPAKYKPFGLDDPFRHVKHRFKGRDIVTCNLETPITSKLYVTPYNGLTMRAEPKAAEVLRDAGFTMAITANNHAFDQSDQGIRDTIQHLFAAGLGSTGTGLTQEGAFEPWIFTKRGVKVGVLAATLLRNFPPKQRIGFHGYVEYGKARAEITPRVRKLKEQVDFVVVSLHLGVEYHQQVSGYERRFMADLEAAGADVILGHHPHVLRPFVRTRGLMIFYSLGNFLFDYGFDNTKLMGIAEVTFAKRGRHREVRSVQFVPVYQDWMRLPVLATGIHGKQVRREIYAITKPFQAGTRFVEQGEILEILPPL
jgi:poly-gamma-glutamate synthesis protein (capsule biosynthesis protein)